MEQNDKEQTIKQLLSDIEQINLDALELRKTKQYLIYKKKQIGKKVLKKKGIISFLYHCFKYNIIIKMNKKEAKTNGEYHYDLIDDEKQVIVYTTIIGDYDEIQEPVFIPKNCKYVLFTDNKQIKSDKWEIRPIPENIEKIQNGTLINRYIKMHPKELFENYDYSIYIDGNVKTVSDISKIVGACNTKTGIAIHRHCTRKCLYKEAKFCMLFKKGKIDKLSKQIKRYKKEGFPKNYGLLECNVIITDLKNDNSTKILNNWWEEFLKTGSNRDQIALPYILWKQGYKIEDVGNLGNNIYLNPKFIVNEHL